MPLTTIRGRSTRFQRRTWVRPATRTTTTITRHPSAHQCSHRHTWRWSSPMATRYTNTAMTRQDTLPTACPHTSRRIPTPVYQHLRYQPRRTHIPCQVTGKGHSRHSERRPCRYGHWGFNNISFLWRWCQVHAYRGGCVCPSVDCLTFKRNFCPYGNNTTDFAG